VVITRSRRAGNAPTVPSRFLLQLETVLRALDYHNEDSDALAPEQFWIEWVRQLDKPAGPIKPISAPVPRPPVEARPQTLSVTQIGTWRRNPYAIYARCILRLEKLEPLEGDATAADKGLAIHKALEMFLRAHPDKLPPDALEQLIRYGREAFAPFGKEPQAMAFWWPRFERIAAWFIDNEKTRRARGIKNLTAEAEGAIKLGDFTLKGRADRIDRLADGSLVIVDYKTGSMPRPIEVKTGLEPQLPLLALIAAEGGFKNLPAAPASEIAYWKLSGGTEPGEQCPVNAPVGELMKSARAGLENLIARFADPATPYLAVPKAGIQPRHNDYAHLARLAEWGRTAEDA
jgi:ATP-dependent helicase/nuclease subunit B